MTLDVSVLWRRLRSNRRGNVLMIFAFAMIPMVFATGMGIDYSRAARLRTKLDAIADAAALSAVTRTSMKDTSDDDVEAAALRMFHAQADGLDGLENLNITFPDGIDHPDGLTSRVVRIDYTANSVNAFGGVLSMRTIAIGGSSTAKAAVAPNIDFYLALDTSPSMALPTTSDGIATLDAALKCSFACHSNKIEENYSTSSTASVKALIRDISQYNVVKGDYGTSSINGVQIQKIDPSGTYIYASSPSFKPPTVDNTIDPNLKTRGGYKVQDLCKASSTDRTNICIYNKDNSFVDSYWYALNKSIPLRVTAERGAINDLMDLGSQYAAINNRTYRAALFTFNHTEEFATVYPPQPLLTLPEQSNLSDVKAQTGGITVATVNDKQGNGCPMDNCGGNNNYLFTSFKSVLDHMLGTGGATPAILPAKSGNGTDKPGDTPKAMLFIVTDGMSDEDIGSGRTRDVMQQAQINQCTVIKNRQIQIAILYTEYTADSIKDDEPTQRDLVTAHIPNVADKLTDCASPGLMYTVKTDESISDALKQLFTKATASARLTQ